MTISRDEDLYGTVVDHYIDKLGYTAVVRLNDGSRMKVAVGEGTHLGDKIYLGPTQRKLDPWDKLADALRVPRDRLRGTATGRIPSGSPSEPTGIKGVCVTTVITDDIDEEPDLAAVDFSKIEARVLAIPSPKKPKKPETDAEQERKLEKLYPLPEPTYTKKQQPAAGPVATDQPNTYGEDKGKELSRAIGKTRLSMEATGWPMQEMIRLGQETVSTMDKESN